MDVGACEAVRWRQLAVEARRRSPLVGSGQEAVHLQVGESARVGQRPGELGHAIGDAAEAAHDTDPQRRERAEVGHRDLARPRELGRGQVAGPGEVVDLIVAFGQQARCLQPPEDVAAAIGAGQADVFAGRERPRPP